ncbi:hypothetical protein HPB51_012773 [Rhipicephalus microplus]|uniref:Voltage-dependent calcium channel alpha-2/delta subunit conserved region domain-containing protein n=1 Tax=Rhipicephalus microplus TaxID=6941 RepID=A0A9J6EAJ0_RHIMP|nr:hypothetical protein HPB51_012773 [Rhipicephalus microplus]
MIIGVVQREQRECACAGDYDYGDYAADDALPIPSKTRARPCDMEIELFEMQPMEPEPIKGKLSKCSDRSCDKQFIVQPVPSSNLVMLAVFTDCNCTSTPAPLAQREVVQDEAIFCNQSSLPRQRPDICINYHAEARDAFYSMSPLLKGLLEGTLKAKDGLCQSERLIYDV